MKQFSLLLTLVITSVLFAQTDKRLKGLTEELNTVIEATKAPGFAVAVVEGEKIIYTKGFGYRDIENKIPVDANTLFAIGSSSKAFTSAILGILREDEKLDFDDNPRNYIPELEFYNGDLNNNLIIKDLMRHSTGIPRHDGAWYFFPTHSKDSLIARMKHQEPFTGIRQQWYYNNFMFLAQGVIAEKITGKSWEDNIKSLFLNPLEMNRTNVDINAMKNAENAAIGYELVDDKISKMDYYDIAAMSPAGSINSSVNDMTKWLVTWINKGKYKDSTIIPESYVKEAMSSQMIVAPGVPNEESPDIHFGNYGYGWFLSSYKGHYRVEHGGNIDGFSANVAFFPSDKVGIVVLANQNGSAVPSIVRNTVADYMLKVKKSDWIERYKKNLEKAKKAEEESKDDSESNIVKNTKPSHILIDYTGTYKNEGYGEFAVVVENDSLFANMKLQKLFMHHVHYDTFELLEVKNGKVDTSAIGKSLKMIFSTNASGDISSLSTDIEPTLDGIEFKRTPNSIDVDIALLNTYVGEYEVAGTTIKVYIKNKDTLYFFVAGQPEYELIPIAKHKFNFKTLEGFKVEFVENDDMSITSLKAIQPNGTFVAKKK